MQQNAAIFTIVSCNYIAYAATLMQSVRRHHPTMDRYIVLSDSYREFPDIDLAAQLTACDDLGIDAIDGMKLWYSVIEFNTAIKPFVFSYLFKEFSYSKICYLDPDILLLDPLEEVLEALDEHNIVLTPHMMTPLQDGKEPSDLTIMKSGVYNLGFLGVRKDPHSMSLLNWWSNRLRFHCRVDIGGHMFTDQRWMDLAPVLVPNPFILRHPGYNVAYWNIAHRVVAKTDVGRWTADDKPLVFFHFSGIKPDDATIFSKHQNRFAQHNLGVVQELCDYYRALVLRNKWTEYAKVRYAFGFFKDGRPIEDVMRRWLVRAIEDERLSPTDLEGIGSDFFDEPEEGIFQHDVRLTRAVYQLWLDRNDLRDAFNLYRADGCEAYITWLLEGDARRQGVDGRTLYAVGRLSNRSFEPAAFAARLTPPWPSVAKTSWPSPSRDAEEFVAKDVLVPRKDVQGSWFLPLEAALLWESRSDLQKHFTFEREEQLDDYLGWILTSGTREGSIHPAQFTPKLIEQLNRTTNLSRFYNDVPLTIGLIATRSGSQKRLHLAHRFPVEFESRVAHGFWYSYLAPKEEGWPVAIVREVRTYFEQPSDLFFDTLRLTRAAVAPWEFRQDLRSAFPKDSSVSIYSYLHWLVVHGVEELGLELDDYAPDLHKYLTMPDAEEPSLTRFGIVAYNARADLQQLFDISSAEGRAAYGAWFLANSVENYPNAPAELLFGKRTTKRNTKKKKSENRPPPVNAHIALTGQWLASTGRGEDVRCSAMSLLAVGFTDFIIIDRDTGKKLTSDLQVINADTPINVSVNIVHMNAETAFIDWQRIRELNVRAKTNVGFWAWELETLPSFWRYCYSFYDEIWASTDFAKRAFQHEHLRPVRLMPMAVVVPENEGEITRRELRLPEDAFIFFFMFDFRSFVSRKNPEAVIRAFQQAFPMGDEKVYLLIKTQGGSMNPDQWFRLKSMCQDTRIDLRDVVLDRNEIVALLKASDAFVSLHRSEGFGRGPAEAMLLEKPTILTGYSGTEDFADSSCAYPISFDLVSVEIGEYPGVDGQRWADPSIDHAAEQMRLIYDRPEEAKIKGERGRERIAKQYAPPVVGATMLAGIFALEQEIASKSYREKETHSTPPPANGTVHETLATSH